MMGFQTGDSYNSYEEILKKVQELEETSFVKLYKRRTTTIATKLTRTPKKTYKDALVYTELDMACIHGGKQFKSKSTGLRPSTSTFQMGCPFLIRFRASKDGEKLVVTSVNEDHNHDVSEKKMPRKYARKPGTRHYKDYSEETLLQAVRECKNDSVRSVSKRYNIPMKTLWNKRKGLHKKTCGGQTILSADEELEIVQNLLTCPEFEMPVKKTELRIFVKHYLDKCNRFVGKFKDNMPGEDWAEGFMKRHSVLLTQMCQNIKHTCVEVDPAPAVSNNSPEVTRIEKVDYIENGTIVMSMPEEIESDLNSYPSTISQISNSSNFPEHGMPVDNMNEHQYAIPVDNMNEHQYAIPVKIYMNEHQSYEDQAEQKLSILVKKRKTVQDCSDMKEQEIWKQYLKCQIRKSEAKAKMLEAQTKMFEAQTLYYQSITRNKQT